MRPSPQWWCDGERFSGERLYDLAVTLGYDPHPPKCGGYIVWLREQGHAVTLVPYTANPLAAGG